jgi:desulfoferrodoxin (superoxide reductase-like protein)
VGDLTREYGEAHRVSPGDITFYKIEKSEKDLIAADYKEEDDILKKKVPLVDEHEFIEDTYLVAVYVGEYASNSVNHTGTHG